MDSLLFNFPSFIPSTIYFLNAALTSGELFPNIRSSNFVCLVLGKNSSDGTTNMYDIVAR